MAGMLAKVLRFIVDNLHDEDQEHYEDDVLAKSTTQASPERSYCDLFYQDYAYPGQSYRDQSSGGVFTKNNPEFENIYRPIQESYSSWQGAQEPDKHSFNAVEAAYPLSEVFVIEPSLYEQIPNAINALKKHKLVVLNLAKMEFKEAQRAIDFLSGGAYIIDGDFEKISTHIFLFTPYCVKLSNPTGSFETENSPQPEVVSPSTPPQYVSSQHASVGQRMPNNHSWQIRTAS